VGGRPMPWAGGQCRGRAWEDERQWSGGLRLGSGVLERGRNKESVGKCGPPNGNPTTLSLWHIEKELRALFQAKPCERAKGATCHGPPRPVVGHHGYFLKSPRPGVTNSATMRVPCLPPPATSRPPSGPWLLAAGRRPLAGRSPPETNRNNHKTGWRQEKSLG